MKWILIKQVSFRFYRIRSPKMVQLQTEENYKALLTMTTKYNQRIKNLIFI